MRRLKRVSLVFLGCKMTIIYKKYQNGVARIELNRPEVSNAFNEQMIADLTDVFDKLANDTEVHVVILSSAGKNFSAGADIDWMRRAANYSFNENHKDALKLSDMLHALYKLKQVTIVQVQGAVRGGGLGLIACCDIGIAEKNSTFSFSEVRLGLIPATISTYVLKAIGARQAKRFFQTAELFDADKAQQIGLVHEVSKSSQETNKITDELLKNILMNAPLAMKKAKELVWDYDGLAITEELRTDSAKRIALARASDEAKEGLSAFLNKRKADWISDV